MQAPVVSFSGFMYTGRYIELRIFLCKIDVQTLKSHYCHKYTKSQYNIMQPSLHAKTSSLLGPLISWVIPSEHDECTQMF